MSDSTSVLREALVALCAGERRLAALRLEELLALIDSTEPLPVVESTRDHVAGLGVAQFFIPKRPREGDRMRMERTRQSAERNRILERGDG